MPLTPDEQLKLNTYLKTIKEKQTVSGLNNDDQTKLQGYLSQIASKTMDETEREKIYGVMRSPTIWDNPILSNIRNVFDIQQEEAKSGLESMKQSVQTGENAPSIPGRIWDAATGALQYGLSPLTGGIKGMVGDPTKNVLRIAGVREAQAEFIGNVAENAAYIATPGGAIKKAIGEVAGPGYQTARGMSEAAKQAFYVTKELPIKIKLAEDAVKETGVLMHPQVKPEVIKEIADVAAESMKGMTLDRTRRITAHLSDWLKSGDINPESIPGILKAEKIAPEQFAVVLSDTISTAGKSLNHMSRLSKQLGFVFEKNPEAAKVFDDIYGKYKNGQTLMMKVLDGFSHMEDIRRGLLVTQMATAVRNAFSQAGRLSLAQVDDAVQTTITGGMKYFNLADEATNSLNILNATIARLSKNGRSELERILTSDAGTIHKARLTSQAVHEIPIGSKMNDNLGLARAAVMSKKAVDFLNIPNRAQEVFFRKIAFEAKFKQLLSNAGMDYKTIDPNKIPKDIYEKAVNYALEMTFSANPKTKEGMELLHAYKKMGLTTINPFPRFAFANAIPFILDHSPMGYLGALSPKSIKALQSGNPELFAKAVSRATLGSLMLKSAWHFRQSEYAGEKWYQIKLNEYEDKGTKKTRYLDVRPYAPFSMYFFIAEAMLHPEKMETKDYAEAAIGLSRLAGTGLVFADLMKSKTAESTKGLMEAFAGAYIGSYTVPAKTVKDIVASIPGQEEEGIVRDTRKNEPWGPLAPAIGNIPGLSRQFPASVNPLSTEPLRTIDPLQRQTLGLTKSEKNDIQREVDRLNIGMENVYPRTGLPSADRSISKIMAPILANVMPDVLLNNAHYKHATEAEQRLMMKYVISSARQAATKLYKKQNPVDAAKIQYEGMSKDEQDVLMSKIPMEKRRKLKLLLDIQ